MIHFKNEISENCIYGTNDSVSKVLTLEQRILLLEKDNKNLYDENTSLYKKLIEIHNIMKKTF